MSLSAPLADQWNGAGSVIAGCDPPPSRDAESAGELRKHALLCERAACRCLRQQRIEATRLPGMEDEPYSICHFLRRIVGGGQPGSIVVEQSAHRRRSSRDRED